jgi:hypothetical protein
VFGVTVAIEAGEDYRISRGLRGRAGLRRHAGILYRPGWQGITHTG